jgi:hypothetical protein
MRNTAVSARMGTWASRSVTHRNEDPLERYTVARAAVTRLRAEVQGLIDWARRAGFDVAEAMKIPVLRQRLGAARVAMKELEAARLSL